MHSLKQIEETSKIITKRFYKMYSEENRLSCNLEKTINYMKVCFDEYFSINDSKKRDLLLKECIMIIRKEWVKLSEDSAQRNNE